MRIIIVEAGRVGESAAKSLLAELNDITDIDADAQRLGTLRGRLDLRLVVGNGIEPDAMRDAGADLLIACAQLDETDLMARKIARDLFNAQTTIARVRSPAQQDEAGAELLAKLAFTIDQIICQERSVTSYINKLVDYPEVGNRISKRHRTPQEWA